MKRKDQSLELAEECASLLREKRCLVRPAHA